MANYSQAVTKTLSIISIASVACLASISSADAGPALSFRANRFKISQSECVRKGRQILNSNSLYTPGNAKSINNTPVVFGEDEEITAIIDCSEVSRSGRVTVMTAHYDSVDMAFYWSDFLLKQFK